MENSVDDALVSAPQSQLYEDLRIRQAEEVGNTAEADYWRMIKAEVDKAPPLGPRQIALLRSLLTTPSGADREAA